MRYLLLAAVLVMFTMVGCAKEQRDGMEYGTEYIVHQSGDYGNPMHHGSPMYLEYPIPFHF